MRKQILKSLFLTAGLTLTACGGSETGPENSTTGGAPPVSTSTGGASNPGTVTTPSKGGEAGTTPVSPTTGGLGGSGGAGGSGGKGGAGPAAGSGGKGGTGPAAGSGGTGGTGGTTPVGPSGGTGGKAAGGTGATSSGGGGPITAPKKFVGNITTGNGIDSGSLIYSKYWDQITPENAGKWGSAQPTAGGAYNWTALDAAYDYATKNNIIFKQHCFVWGSQQPSNESAITEAMVKAWMKAYCERYPKTALIDVVNEPPSHTEPKYSAAIGGGTKGDWKWIANAFKWAREACPDAVLILNDYNDIEYQDQTDNIVNIVTKIKALDAPIDAVGAQAHDLDLLGISKVDQVKGLISRLHTGTGLPVYITEFDISTTDDAAQLALYKAYFPFFLETDYIHGMTIWGWIYGRTWDMAKDSGLVKDGKSRPAMSWLMEQLGRPAP